MTKILSIVSLSLLFVSCANNNKPASSPLLKDTSHSVSNVKNVPAAADSNYFIVGDDSVTILPFEVKVDLTPKAADRIFGSNETIIVRIYFEGMPKHNAHAKLEEDGSFFVASAEKEISGTEPVRFENVKFSRKIYNQLVDKNVDFNINVFSGRRSSKDNLLNGGYLFGKVSELVNQQSTINCKLIYGDD